MSHASESGERGAHARRRRGGGAALRDDGREPQCALACLTPEPTAAASGAAQAATPHTAAVAGSLLDAASGGGAAGDWASSAAQVVRQCGETHGECFLMCEALPTPAAARGTALRRAHCLARRGPGSVPAVARAMVPLARAWGAGGRATCLKRSLRRSVPLPWRGRDRGARRARSPPRAPRAASFRRTHAALRLQRTHTHRAPRLARVRHRLPRPPPLLHLPGHRTPTTSPTRRAARCCSRCWRRPAHQGAAARLRRPGGRAAPAAARRTLPLH